MSPEQNATFYLLSIRGQLAAPTLEEARVVHNATAGGSANIAAARSLGDVSHMVYVPADQAGDAAGEFLILDLWNSLEGLNQFFANPQVQEGGGKIFTQRDPVVWAPAPGFLGYHLPAPHGCNDRTVAVVRGPVQSVEHAQRIHNAFAASQVNKARMAGNLSHEAYLRLAAPGTPEALEFFAVDTWMDAEGMASHYADPGFGGALQELFAGPPAFSIWRHPAGIWAVW